MPTNTEGGGVKLKRPSRFSGAYPMWRIASLREVLETCGDDNPAPRRRLQRAVVLPWPVKFGRIEQGGGWYHRLGHPT
jgi:hypothetical protein